MSEDGITIEKTLCVKDIEIKVRVENILASDYINGLESINKDIDDTFKKYTSLMTVDLGNVDMPGVISDSIITGSVNVSEEINP